MLTHLYHALGRRSAPTRFLIATLLTVVLAVLDLFSGPDLSLALFYLLPIGGLAWYNSQRSALALTLLVGLAWMGDGVAGGLPTAIAVWNATLRCGFFLIVVMLIARLHAAYELQATMASQDLLTGLANGRAMAQALTALIERSHRHPEPYTVAYLDLDGFKQVNDRLGHQGGDATLRAVAQAIQAAVRAQDLSARVGGDEFLVLLVGCDTVTAHSVLDRIRDTVRARSEVEGWGISVSIGAVSVTMMPTDVTVDAIIQRADAAMYSAKRAGKDQVITVDWTEVTPMATDAMYASAQNRD